MAAVKAISRQAATLVDRWHWLFLLAAAPFLLFPSPARSPALLIVPGLWIIAGLAGREPLPRTPLNAALLLLSVMVLVSLYATFDIAFSLPKIAGVLLGIAAYFAIARWLGSREKLWLAIQLFALAGGGLSMVALLGTDWFYKIPILGGVVEHLPPVIRGLPGAEEGFQPNAVAGALVLFVPPQFTLLLASGGEPSERWPLWLNQQWLKVVQFLLLAFTGGVLLLTQSRGAWLGFGLAMIALFAWHSRRTRWLLGLLLVIALAVVIVIGPQNVSGLASRQGVSDLGLKAEGRLELWSRAVYGIRDFPFTGMGMNNFRRVMPVLYPAFLIPPDFDVAHAHNHLLQVALDLGLPGLIAYLALWLGTGHMFISAYRLSRDPWLRSVIEGLGAGLIAHFIFGMGDAIPLGAKVGIVFWIVLGLAVGLFRVAYDLAHPSALVSEIALSKL